MSTPSEKGINVSVLVSNGGNAAPLIMLIAEQAFLQAWADGDAILIPRIQADLRRGGYPSYVNVELKSAGRFSVHVQPINRTDPNYTEAA